MTRPGRLVKCHYSKATITITASRARHVQDGMLKARENLHAYHLELIFKLPYRCPEGNVGSVTISPSVQLDRRASALQERFMSPRILGYGSIHTRWTCPQIEEYKSITDVYKDDSVYNQKRSAHAFSRARKSVLASTIGLTMDTKSLGKVYFSWNSLLEIYTHRTLRKPANRLLAISGIAACFAQRLKDDYVAGLWRSRFLLGELLWTVAYGGSRQLRPSKYQGPSWSWAGINSPITLHSRSEQLHKNFKIIKCQVELSSKGTMTDIDLPKYGAVASGTLEVQGLLRPAKWVPDQSKWDEFQTPVLMVQI
jgi:hypothetical protein